MDVFSQPSHYAWCPRTISKGTTLRHNAVVDVLASLARVAGVQPFVEPRELPADDDGKRRRQGKRPDIMMFGFDEVKIVDVSIVHPLAPRYVETWHRDHAEAEQRIIIAREKRKRRQHAKLAAKTPDSVVAPFVLDALGAFGADADALLQWLGLAAVENHSFPTVQAFVNMANGWVATALQRGNAFLIASSLPRMRSLLSGRALRA
jgi:hypothetical protein